MTDRNYGLMRIFWPSNVPSDDIPGVVIGWRNGELDVLVVGVLQGVDVRKE
jgi:phosphatidylinositol glycan class Q protein